jgi:hypothetical protein
VKIMAGKREDRERISREALRAATGEREPDLRRLLDAAPEIVREARRRRTQARDQGIVTATIPLAWKAIPGMSAAALVLAAVAVGVFLTDQGAGINDSQDLDTLILSGESSTVDADLIFETIVGQENGDG